MEKRKYYFYIMSRDYGFAPNPFYGYCTLACCKSKIRKQAKIGDWIIGLGSNSLKCRGNIIYAMKVTETLTFDEYYKDKRFSLKKPNIKGSLKTMHGDNVYHRNSKQKWLLDDCHHNHLDKVTRHSNIKMDTIVNKVLISNHFFYFGRNPLSNSNTVVKRIKEGTKKLGQSFTYKLEKEGVELVKMLIKKYRKNSIYGEPNDWSNSFYKKQFKKQ